MAQKNLRRRHASVKKKEKPKATPILPAIGKELRGIANRFKLGESCLIVINMALDGQDVEQDYEISTVLRHVLNRHFFEPIRDLENVAAKCDGEAPSDRNEANEDEPEDDEDASAPGGAS